MGLGRLNEEVRDACSRDYVGKTTGIPSTTGSNVICLCAVRFEGDGDSSSIKRQLRTAANDVYLVPVFRDFT